MAKSNKGNYKVIYLNRVGEQKPPKPKRRKSPKVHKRRDPRLVGIREAFTNTVNAVSKASHRRANGAIYTMNRIKYGNACHRTTKGLSIREEDDIWA